jgi:hypothetical protein
MNVEERKIYEKEWRNRNRERVRQVNRIWKETNSDKVKKYTRAWNIANAEKIRVQHLKNRWKSQNKEKVAITNRLRQERLKRSVVESYGGHCVCCGENEIRFLTIDHVNHDGKEHRAPGINVYQDLIKRGFPKDGFRLLCMNCNFATRFKIPCPHQLNVNKLFNLQAVA